MTTHRLRSPITRPLAAALCLALAGCTGQAPPAGESPTTAAIVATAQLAGVSAVDLRKRAQLALREQRLFAPAGDNAIEFYVALRGRSATPDADAQGALMELQPYAVIGAEQALARGDVVEAERLRRLIAAIDPAAPSLGRIADAIAAKVGARAQEALEMTAAAESLAKIEPTPEESLPAPSPAPELPAVSGAPSPAPAPVAVAAPATPSPPPQAAPAQATPQATSRAVASRPASELIPVRTPPPEYPDDKRRNGMTGQVVASFTVLSDGTVGNIGLESVGARHLGFERNVLRALKRWKYQPPGEERSVKLSFAFGP